MGFSNTGFLGGQQLFVMSDNSTNAVFFNHDGTAYNNQQFGDRSNRTIIFGGHYITDS